MSLEVASYIAGIIAAVAGVWSLYYAREQLKRQHRDAVRDSKNGAELSESSPKPASAHVQPRSEPEESRRTFVDITGVPSELVVAFNTTDTIFSKPRRDEAIKELIRKALQLGHIEFAIGLASRVWHKPTKDAVLNTIVDAALGAEQVELAHKASEHYFNTPHKDALKRKIIDHVSNA